jgi:hypothetical protein
MIDGTPTDYHGNRYAELVSIDFNHLGAEKTRDQREVEFGPRETDACRGVSNRRPDLTLDAMD